MVPWGPGTVAWWCAEGGQGNSPPTDHPGTGTSGWHGGKEMVRGQNLKQTIQNYRLHWYFFK